MWLLALWKVFAGNLGSQRVTHRRNSIKIKISKSEVEINMKISMKIKRLADTVEMPTRAHVGDACFDLRAHIPDVSFHEWNGGVEVKETKGIKIRPGETVMVPTGIATEIPAGFFAPIFARSGLASKQGLRPAQGTCVIDSGYRGEWMIPLHNDSAETRIVHHGDRICQFMLLPVPDVYLEEVSFLSSSDRAEGGFGSSGF